MGENPHLRNMKAINRDIKKTGYAPNKGRAFDGAAKRARSHRLTKKSAG